MSARSSGGRRDRAVPRGVAPGRVPGRDHEGGGCTAVVYRLTDVVGGRVVRVVVVAPDATERGACALPPPVAAALATAIHAAATEGTTP